MNSELIKYVIAGGIAFTVDFSLLYFCTEFLGMHYLLSNFFGYFAGLAVAYGLNVRWVFSYRRYRQKTWLEFFIFNTIVIVGLGISEGMMAALVDVSGMYYLYAKIVTSFFVALFNFTAKKFILFHPAPAPRH